MNSYQDQGFWTNICQYGMCICLFIFLQILAQHIKAVLPGLRARISTSLVAVAKEYASYGEITESKACVNTGICILDISPIPILVKHLMHCITILLIVIKKKHFSPWLEFFRVIYHCSSLTGWSGCTSSEYSFKIL